MSQSADVLLDTLREAGMRLTQPRRALCAVIAENVDEHLSASGLQERAEDVLGRPVDLSTVYRTIDVLQEHGLLHHVHLGHGASVVHLSDPEVHHHLVCDLCERTVDLPLDELAPLADLLQRHGFSDNSVHFAIVGRCSHHDD
jgi:Fur family transcriptional regulator, ferric uptake regulator